MGFFGKIKEGLKKTRDSIANGVNGIINSFTKIDEELFEQLEETLVMSDIGVETSVEICERLRKRIKETGITDPAEIKNLMKEIIVDMLGEDEGLRLETKPSVILVIGVNGVGKTTVKELFSARRIRSEPQPSISSVSGRSARALLWLKAWREPTLPRLCLIQ